MADYREAFVRIDVAKRRNAVAIAEAGWEGEVRFFGEVDASVTDMGRIIARIANRFDRVHFNYEAGPTGYGLYRLIRSLGHECTVAAPSLIPRKPGDRVKTNRRDAVSLARLLRAGELTAVRVPDEGHEAMRDLVRARAAAVEALGGHRQQVSAFYPFFTRWLLPRKNNVVKSISVRLALVGLRPEQRLGLCHAPEGVELSSNLTFIAIANEPRPISSPKPFYKESEFCANSFVCSVIFGSEEQLCSPAAGNAVREALRRRSFRLISQSKCQWRRARPSAQGRS